MRYFFIDTNVMLDLVAGREPFVNEALQLFDLADKKQVRLYCSAMSFNNIYYIVKKVSNQKNATLALNLLRHQVSIIDLDKNILFKALDSEFKDYEDGIQYYSSINNDKIECLVTRNPKDFKLAEIPIITPDLAVYNILNDIKLK